MLNRLQPYPPPANVAPVKLPARVARVEENPLYVINFKPSTAEVSLCAYYLFLNQGGQHGFDLDHWFAAEAQLVAEHHARETGAPVLRS